MSVPSPKWVHDNFAVMAKLWWWMKARLIADHAALRSLHGNAASGGAKDFRLHVALGPSRNSRRIRLPGHEAATGFIQATLGISAEVDYSSGELLRLKKPIPGMDFPARIQMQPNGLVDALLPLPYEASEDGGLLTIRSVLEPVNLLANSVRDHSYFELFGMRRRPMDWFVSLSPYIDGEHGPFYWSSLRFRGREPLRKAPQLPYAGPRGLAPDKLLSLSSRTPPEQLERTVLVDLLRSNGYDGVEGAVDDALVAVCAKDASSASPERQGEH